jgi:ABC-type branched-subunit amino acid transport system permease subunit
MGDYRNILFGLLIIAAMNFRPQGLVDGNFRSDLAKLLGLKPTGGGNDA